MYYLSDLSSLATLRVQITACLVFAVVQLTVALVVRKEASIVFTYVPHFLRWVHFGVHVIEGNCKEYYSEGEAEEEPPPAPPEIVDREGKCH